MMPTADLTVIISTLGRPADLVRCLEAVLTGDLRPSEVIVVDQSPDDRTLTALETCEACEPGLVRIRYVHQEKRGLSASRNAGAARATGAVVAFTDDDCVPSSAWLRAIDQAFSSSPGPDAVAGRVLPLGPEMPETYAVSLRENAARVDYRGRTVPWLVGTGANLALRREWLSRVGPFDERLGVGSPGRAAEDSDYFHRLLRAGGRIRYEPGAVVYHARQSRAQRLASRRSYGHGIGALCGLWLRRGDYYAALILSHWLLATSRELAGALRRGRWFEAQQRMLGFAGAAKGLAYGLGLSSSTTDIDTSHPPRACAPPEETEELRP